MFDGYFEMWTCDRCMVAVRGAQISSIQVDSPSLPAGWVYGEYCWDTGHQGQETLCEECSQQELEDYKDRIKGLSPGRFG